MRILISALAVCLGLEGRGLSLEGRGLGLVLNLKISALTTLLNVALINCHFFIKHSLRCTVYMQQQGDMHQLPARNYHEHTDLDG